MSQDRQHLFAEAHQLLVEANQRMRQGQYRDALAFFQQAAQVFHECGQLHNWFTCLCQVAEMLRVQGQYAEAEDLLRWVAIEADRLNSPLAHCNALGGLGDVLRLQGRDAEAEDWLRWAARDAADLDDPLTCSNIFDALGNVLRKQGRNAEAENWLRRAAQEAAKLDDPLTRCNAFGALGDTLHLQGQYTEAENWLRRAAQEAAKLDDPLTRCNAFRHLGELLHSNGRDAEAGDWLQQAADEAAKLDQPLTRCNTFGALARALRAQGRYAEAEGWGRRATDEAAKLDDPLTRCNAFLLLGQMLRRQDRDVEAGDWLQRAADEAAKLDISLTHVNVAVIRGGLALDLGQLDKRREFCAEAQAHLLKFLSQNRKPEAVGNIMAKYGPIFTAGVQACEQVWREEPGGHTDRLWQGLEFADGAKCVAIREGLRRHGRRESGKEPAVPWRAAPLDRDSLFWARETVVQANLQGAQRAVRGLRGTAADGSAEPAESILEFPGEIDEAKREFCQPVDRAAVKQLLPDPNTVLVVFFFDGDGLVLLPLRKDAAGEPQLLHTPEGYFRVPDVLAEVRRLANEQEGCVDVISDKDFGLINLSAAELKQQADMTHIYRDLYRVLRFGDLLELIEGNIKPLQLADIHLVLIPDGRLYHLPLHAACAAPDGPRLYEHFKSVRYGLSLRTLELQQRIQDEREKEEAADRTLRGVAFANPDRKRVVVQVDGVPTEVEKVLAGVIKEVEVLVEETSAANWWLHGEREPADQQTIRANLRERHRAGNVGWTMGHGVDDETARQHGWKDEFALPDGHRVSVAEASLFLCDGLVSMSRMLAEKYDLSYWRLFNISACLLGKLRELGASKEVLGYIAVLTLLGCRRVCSALWPISDAAAPEFARHWIRAINKHVFGPTPPGPHAFAVAFKEALDNFRGAGFDHEYFWAPYTLYGLG